ncbi:MAG TPA: M13-type metalloendopeptidase [Xanthomonadaceae bacterium]|jgi:predicted metalloendopeptidase
MKRTIVVAIGLCLLSGIAGAATPPTSGLNAADMDKSVRAQDDLYQHINGHWLATTQIPADKATYGVFDMLYDKSLADVRSIIEDAQKAPHNDGERKIGDFYASFMDEGHLETLGLKPLQPELDRIDAMKGTDDLPALIAHFGLVGIDAPFGGNVHQDNKDSTKYVVDFGQSGLGLPDRDYYLKDDDAKLKGFRDQYVGHVERMLALSGDANAKADAASVLALETSLAKVQWSKVENRDPVKVYNKVMLADLPALMPGFDWKAYLADARVAGKVDYVIVSQPSYFKGLADIIRNTPVPVWKAYFRWHALHAAAPYLSKAYVDENFAFYGTVLRGVPQNRPRWQRGVRLLDGTIGEQLGQVYVSRYFPPASKARVTELVHNLLAAYKQSIDTLDWMSPATKQQALAKLSMYMLKLGYPDKWRDYSALRIDRDDLLGNVARASEFEYMRNINKLGQPIDRSEWGMNPQTINAYYNPEMNEIVFPAAILQPPFFDPKADDAVNYGAIGAVIGHEISHGFDDQGSQYDGSGNLHDWWTKDDHTKFAAKTKALVDEYAAFEPVKGYHLNGELTLGENIADNSGLAIAYKAYKISLHGQKSPVIDGMTGEQRFYAGFAQVWREKMRDNAMIEQIKSNEHSIPIDRVLGTVVNQPGFYDAFGVKPGDRMYVAPDKRVIIW